MGSVRHSVAYLYVYPEWWRIAIVFLQWSELNYLRQARVQVIYSVTFLHTIEQSETRE